MDSIGILEAFLTGLEAQATGIICRRHSFTDLFGQKSETGAVLDGEESYRYLLWRIWDQHTPLLIIIMLNPSTADERDDDQTIKTITARAKAEGYGGLIVANLFAWRDKSPQAMKKSNDPIGPYNDLVIDHLLQIEGLDLLCAWGTHGTYKQRDKEILCKIRKKGIIPLILRISKTGQPEHPLYKDFSEKFRAWPEFTGMI